MVYVSIFWWIPLFPTHSCRWERAGSDLHVNEVNENSARLESFCAVPTKVLPSSPHSRFLLNLTQISRESICESSITLFKAASHFVLRLPWMRILGVGDLGGEAWRLTGGHYGRQRPLSSSARGPWKLLHCYPRMMDRGSVITHQPNFNNSKCRPWQWSL